MLQLTIWKAVAVIKSETSLLAVALVQYRTGTDTKANDGIIDKMS